MRVKYVSMLPRMPNINFGFEVTGTYKENILAAVFASSCMYTSDMAAS